MYFTLVNVEDLTNGIRKYFACEQYKEGIELNLAKYIEYCITSLLKGLSYFIIKKCKIIVNKTFSIYKISCKLFVIILSIFMSEMIKFFNL